MLPRDQCAYMPRGKGLSCRDERANLCCVKLHCLDCIAVRGLHRLSPTRSANYLVVPTLVGESSRLRYSQKTRTIVQVTALNQNPLTTLHGNSEYKPKKRNKCKKTTFHRDSVRLLLATKPLRPVWMAVTRTSKKVK
jgi:hypothetical protein